MDNFRLIGMTDLEFTVYVLALNSRHRELKKELDWNIPETTKEGIRKEISVIQGMLLNAKR